jgi:hypothetical protein
VFRQAHILNLLSLQRRERKDEIGTLEARQDMTSLRNQVDFLTENM